MIKRFLRHLRQQPKGVRDNIALGVAVSFTAVVVFGWMYSLPMKIADRMERLASGNEEKPGFTALFKGIKDQVAEVADAVDTDEAAVIQLEREVVGEDYQIVMPNAAQVEFSSTTTSSTKNAQLNVATSTDSATTSLRAIRIVTTNTTSTSSTASSTR
ncbi:hypothetical protein KC902_04370 [Candidatus Kaiserbacteria bacterium]|nr:hypothetical protein [Candidatus Kaiserbacteria bacterium]USN88510.1 MAG: hypothetical protein H6780_03385 [Candidatus Nomurabacteria bacterium]